MMSNPLFSSISLLLLLFVSCCLSQGDYSCPALPPIDAATNINNLRVKDVKVVMALGDSITAAFGLEGVSGGLNEYRGQSWSVGGDTNATTLANLFKYFNSDIQGASQGSHIVELCYGPLCPPFQYHPEQDILNAAQSGALVSDLPSHELDYLIKQVKANKNINFNEDWKVLSILIGANDLCASCTFAKDFLDPDTFEKHLSATLEGVRLNIPRVFVQVVEMFNLSQVYDLSLKTPACANIHRSLFIECDCIFSPGANKTRGLVDEIVQQYNARIRAQAAYYQALGDGQFTVVAQPFGRDTSIKLQPPDILSTLDCFHPSLLGHQAMAVALWNNMLTPAAQKKTSLNMNDVPLCPTADTLLYTS